MLTKQTAKHQITLFSETDPSGIITFVNDDFCNVAKYTDGELIGKSHNIIRHPDMPPKLFEILWSQIQSKQVFRGIIKNKAKDHAHYWVRATIMPVLGGNSEIIKYVAVMHLIEDDMTGEKLFTNEGSSYF